MTGFLVLTTLAYFRLGQKCFRTLVCELSRQQMDFVSARFFLYIDGFFFCGIHFSKKRRCCHFRQASNSLFSLTHSEAGLGLIFTAPLTNILRYSVRPGVRCHVGGWIFLARFSCNGAPIERLIVDDYNMSIC